MSDGNLPPDPYGVELAGLPERGDTSARDNLELIASDYLNLLRMGRPAEVESFAVQHPQLAEEIREFLPLVAALEDWKGHEEWRANHRPMPKEFQIESLGECRILREIARGGMGVVFEAEQGAIGRRVAVKLLPAVSPKNSGWAERFRREAQIAANLQHGSIVPVFSFGEQDRQYYYVMQLIQGVGLDQLIRRWNRDGGLVAMEDLIGEFHPSVLEATRGGRRTERLLRHGSWVQIAKIAAQIASALKYAHQQGTLHRDIKPANLLIDLQGKVWITDFGIAVMRDPTLDEAPGTLAGTIRYMAPEQFESAGDERSDLYSFGLTLYELCTLQPAFIAKDRMQLLDDIRRGGLIPPRQIRRSIPVPLERIILKAAARDPEQRFQSAEELNAALLDLIAKLSGSSSSLWWRRLRRWMS